MMMETTSRKLNTWLKEKIELYLLSLAQTLREKVAAQGDTRRPGHKNLSFREATWESSFPLSIHLLLYSYPLTLINNIKREITVT